MSNYWGIVAITGILLTLIIYSLISLSNLKRRNFKELAKREREIALMQASKSNKNLKVKHLLGNDVQEYYIDSRRYQKDTEKMTL